MTAPAQAQLERRNERCEIVNLHPERMALTWYCPEVRARYCLLEDEKLTDWQLLQRAIELIKLSRRSEMLARGRAARKAAKAGQSPVRLATYKGQVIPW